MAATLSILRNQGMLQGPSQEQLDRERRQKDQDRWMALQRAKAAAREAERVAAKAQGSAKDQATREADNRARELAEARGALDNFRDYKPDINIVYHDEVCPYY